MIDPHAAAPVRAPEPLSHLRFSHDRRRAVAFGPSGRAWVLEIDPERRAVDFQPLPITVPPEKLDEWHAVVAGSHALDRLLVALPGEQARVYAIPSGEVIAEPGPMPGGVHCLSPGGRWLLSADQQLAWGMDLEAEPEWVDTNAFHELENDRGETEELYLDHVDYLVTHPYEGDDPVAEEGEAGDERFWVAAACYGMVAVHLARGREVIRAVVRVPGRTKLASKGIVYDPTLVLSPFGQRHAFVVHGSGTGVAAVDPETGELHHCELRPGCRQPYSFVHHVVPCGQAPTAYVGCKDGSFLWRVGQAPVRIPEPAGPVIALYPDVLLCGDGETLTWEPIDGGAAEAPGLKRKKGWF